MAEPDPGLVGLSDDELIRLAYAVTLEPERYGELIEAWSRNIDQLSDTDQVDGLNRHFDRALTIMDRLGRGDQNPLATAGDLVRAREQASLVLAPGGSVLASNLELATFCGKEPRKLGDLHLSAENGRDLEVLLRDLEIQRKDRALMVLRLYREADNAALIMAASAVELQDGSLALQLSSLDLANRNQVGELVGETFGLTRSEVEIAQGIVDGFSPAEIAERRGRALETIRTQLKSILQKADLRSQTELIRVFAGFGELVDARSQDKALQADRVVEFVVRPGNRKLAYECFGPPKGRPALFLHGMLDGLPIGPKIDALLSKHDIRLIGIWRPAFHLSDPDGAIAGAPARFCEDIRAVLDHLDIETAPILAHLGGSLYAFAAAAHLGQRISSLVVVGGAVPFVGSTLIRKQPARQRIIGLTAKYFPASLPLLLRAGIGDFDADGGRRFIGDLYNKLPRDHEVISAPGNFELYRNELAKGLSQGFRGFQIDAAAVVQDWSSWVAATHQRVDLIHGAHDQVVQIEAVRAFSKSLPEGELHEISDLGQLVLYARPEIVVETLARQLGGKAAG